MKKVLLIIFALITVIAIGIYGNYSYKVNKKLYVIDKEFEINKGDRIYSVLKKLEIDVDYNTKIYLRLHPEVAKSMKAGYYELKGSFTLADLTKKLQKGLEKHIKVTIPEGFSLVQIKERLYNLNLIDMDKFDEILKNKKDFPYLTPNNNFEGYFFPDTYFIPEKANEERIVKIFLDRFLKEFPAKDYADKKDFYNKLIMASIIEKETGNKDERSLVSSVFYNRLDKKMKLQSCATVAYLFDYKKDRITYKDLKIDSKYNTYLNPGLPIAPISNPGKKAILASFTPDKTDYLYFVLTKTGEHHFSTNYKEHVRVKNKN